MLLTLLVSTTAMLAHASTNDKVNLVLIRLQNDMTYGTDDFFGGNRDILYVDAAQHSIKNAAKSAEASSVTVSTDKPKKPPRKDPEAETVNSPTSSPAPGPSAPVDPVDPIDLVDPGEL
jgi:hypothetical protein